MLNRRRRRRVLRSWRLRRVQSGPTSQSEAAAALARRGKRRKRPVPLAWTRRRRLRRPARLGLALALAGLVLALGGVVATGADRIHGASVAGNRRISSQAVYLASGLDGSRALGADTAAAARRIEALDGIRRAEVRVWLPNRAAIRIEETRLALWWHGPKGTFAVDEQGLVLAPPGDPKGLVPVEDPAGTVQRPGQRLERALVDAALAFAARFGSLSYRPETGFSALSPEGWEVRLGQDAATAPRQLDLLGAVRRELSGRPTEVAFVDLRFVNRPYYRLRGGSE
jgi:hypothetical protein